MQEIELTAKRPYMLRGFYDWMADNDLTPHIVVDATLPGVRVPTEFVDDGQIVLNIAQRAVGNLELSNDAITFHARFSGRPHSVYVPMYAVIAIYARENGAGTMFEPEEAYQDIESIELEEASQPEVEIVALDTQAPVDASDDEPDPDSPPPRPSGRPSLTVVK